MGYGEGVKMVVVGMMVEGVGGECEGERGWGMVVRVRWRWWDWWKRW